MSRSCLMMIRKYPNGLDDHKIDLLIKDTASNVLSNGM